MSEFVRRMQSVALGLGVSPGGLLPSSVLKRKSGS
jgi:hypothetical protein